MKLSILNMLVCILVVKLASAQELNLDMEVVDAYGQPAVWRMGHSTEKAIVYRMLADSSVKHGGLYSMKLFSNSDRAEVASSFIQIPLLITGKTVTVKGFLKTENVQVGVGTLFLALLADDTTVVAYDNMLNSGKALKGTKDWTALSITLPISEKVTKINFGSILQGSGTLWIDDFTLLIDDTKITNAPVLQPYIKDPKTGKLRKFK